MPQYSLLHPNPDKHVSTWRVRHKKNELMLIYIFQIHASASREYWPLNFLLSPISELSSSADILLSLYMLAFWKAEIHV